MALFKSLFAATALFTVALSSTAISSEVAPSVVTSIELVTSVTFVSPSLEPSSSKCATTTVTEVGPPSTVTVTKSAPVSSGAGSSSEATIPISALSSVTPEPLPTHCSSVTITASDKTVTSVQCLEKSSASFSLPPNELTATVTSTKEETGTITQTSEVPYPTTSVHGTTNSSGTAPTTTLTFPHTIPKNSTAMTATGTGGASASASYSPPPFTAAADATKMGAASLAGGILIAIFGF